MDIVLKSKVLGTIKTDDLKWNRNTDEIVKKANRKMVLLSKLSEFGATEEELKNIYVLFVRSVLEQSCTVWNFGLTAENIQKLERVQKTAMKII